MTFLLSLLLPIVVVALMVGTTASLWRSSLPSLWAFVVFASLTLLGLHRILQAVAAVIEPMFVSKGYFLEAQKQQTFIQLAERAITTEAVVVAVVLAVLSWPLLSWLRVLLSK